MAFPPTIHDPKNQTDEVGPLLTFMLIGGPMVVWAAWMVWLYWGSNLVWWTARYWKNIFSNFIG